MRIYGGIFKPGTSGRQIERVQRQRYEQLLEKKLKHQEDLHTCVCMVKNLMKLGDFGKAHEIFTNYREKMAPTRSVLDFEGSILRRTEAGRRTEKNIDKMKKEHIYLSSKGREDLALWIDS